MGRKGSGNGNRDKDGFERLETTGSDGEDDLFVSSRMRDATTADGQKRMKFSLDEDDGSSSDSDAEVFSRQGSLTAVSKA